MSSSATVRSRPASLIGPSDPPPFTVINPDGRANAVLVCDHGGRAVPGALNGLGLDPALLDRHIAWDIGAAAVTRALAARLPQERFVYLGDHIRTRLTVSGNSEFIVKIPNAYGHVSLNEGEQVTVGWATEDCRALDA